MLSTFFVVVMLLVIFRQYQIQEGKSEHLREHCRQNSIVHFSGWPMPIFGKVHVCL